MKKMISASMALSVMDDPHVGPTVVMLILSAVGVGTAFAGEVVLVVEDAVEPAAALVVVVAALVVLVVVTGVDLGACAAVTARRAFWTLALTAFCWACDSLFMSDWTVRVCLLPEPRSCTVGSMTPVPFMASAASLWVTPGAAIVHSVPPLNSMPRFRPPRRMIEMMPTTMMRVERLNQIFRLPTKSNRVSPR